MATTSAPYESLQPHGRPDSGAAAARTAQLYAQYERTVSGLCRALLRNRAEAEDAAQQTFLSAHRALLGGTDPREPAAWLATIARNECWGRIRTRMREPLATDEIDAATTELDPLAEAIRRADLAELWRAIEALPRQQRDALLLREFGGLSYGELAAALAVSAPAVESLLFRARQRLRTQLSTAYASVTGASWLEALARLFAGGGAPVAAKVAALGVGAAAVTGGAVVAPQVFDNQHRRTPAPPRTTAAVHHAAPVAVPPAPSSAVLTIARPSVFVPVELRHAETERGDAVTAEGSVGSRREGRTLEESTGSTAPLDGTSSTSDGGGEPSSGSDSSGSGSSGGDSVSTTVPAPPSGDSGDGGAEP